MKQKLNSRSSNGETKMEETYLHRYSIGANHMVYDHEGNAVHVGILRLRSIEALAYDNEDLEKRIQKEKPEDCDGVIIDGYFFPHTDSLNLRWRSYSVLYVKNQIQGGNEK